MTYDDNMSKDLFCITSDSELESLKQKSSIKCFKKGDTIINEMDNSKLIFIILKGNACLYKIDSNFDRRIILILKEQSWMNEESLTNSIESVSCESMTNTEILCVDRNELLKVVKRNPNLATKVLEKVAKKNARLYRQIKNAATTLSIEKKVASKLWKLSRDYGQPKGDSVEIKLHISPSFLADMIGSKRETVTRTLRKLEEEGYIIQKNRIITVISVDKLAEFYRET